MQLALPPPPHHALCKLAERLEVGFAEILRLIICRPLSAEIGEGIRCWQGSCELFGGDHRELHFQPGPCRGARGTPHAKDTART